MERKRMRFSKANREFYVEQINTDGTTQKLDSCQYQEGPDILFRQHPDLLED